MSFSETFDFWAIFYVGYAVYLGVASAVSVFWIVFTRKRGLLYMDRTTGVIGRILALQFKLVYALLRLGRSPASMPTGLPSYRQIFTIAGTTGVALATLSGIVVVSLQWVESLA